MRRRRLGLARLLLISHRFLSIRKKCLSSIFSVWWKWKTSKYCCVHTRFSNNKWLESCIKGSLHNIQAKHKQQTKSMSVREFYKRKYRKTKRHDYTSIVHPFLTNNEESWWQWYYCCVVYASINSELIIITTMITSCMYLYSSFALLSFYYYRYYPKARIHFITSHVHPQSIPYAILVFDKMLCSFKVKFPNFADKQLTLFQYLYLCMHVYS